jgi:hypothetical protein
LANNFADYVVSVMIAVRSGEDDYAEFHVAYSFGERLELVCICTTSKSDCLGSLPKSFLASLTGSA